MAFLRQPVYPIAITTPLMSSPQPRSMAPNDQRMLVILAAVGVLVLFFLAALWQIAGALSGRTGVLVGTVNGAALGGPGAPGRGILSPVFTAEVRYWESRIVGWATEHNLDPNMVATVMQIESCGDPQALSRAGARGLFQVMPYHFAGDENHFDPDTNAHRGLNYLAERLVQTRGDVGRAFAGYNGGHVAAGSDWNSWSNETQRYYVWSTGIYQDARAGLSSSPTLERWLAAGGASLCRQAAGRLGLAVE